MLVGLKEETKNILAKWDKLEPKPCGRKENGKL